VGKVRVRNINIGWLAMENFIEPEHKDENVTDIERKVKINGFLTVQDVARMLNIHINTVRRWSNLGILRSYRIGPRSDRRFHKEDIAKLLRE
jgi:excisionase family DNA binding protein